MATTSWWAGKSFAVCIPHSSLNSCHEWMALTSWTPGSAADTVLATWQVLVVRNGCADVGGNQKLWTMYPVWGHLCQNPNATHHCYCSFEVVTHWLYQHWDNGGVGSTLKCGECLGLLWPLYKTCYDICDPWSNCEDCHQVSVARIYLNLWSTSQAPQWPRSQPWKQHHQRALWACWHTEG